MASRYSDLALKFCRHLINCLVRKKFNILGHKNFDNPYEYLMCLSVVTRYKTAQKEQSQAVRIFLSVLNFPKEQLGRIAEQ